VVGLAGIGVGRKFHPSAQFRGIGLAQDQVSVARQDAHVVSVFVKRMFPPPLSYGANQHQVPGMHVGIPVVGLVGIVGRIVGVHVVWHGTPVDQVVARMIGLGLDFERGRARKTARSRNATGDGLYLLFCLFVDSRIELHELEQVFAVVTGRGVIVRRGSQPVIGVSQELGIRAD